jgi:murein L,D-transpeptidase YcbB/YkuD
MRGRYFKPFVFLLTFLTIASGPDFARPAEKLLYPREVNKFYTANNNTLLWTGMSTDAAQLRSTLQELVAGAQYLGLDKDKYHYGYLSRPLRLYNDIDADMIYTDAAIAFFRDLYTGSLGEGMLGYDEISGKYRESENKYLLDQLLPVKSPAELVALQDRLEPGMPEYKALKTELGLQIANKSAGKARAVAIALNYYRRMFHYKFDKFIVVNICSTVLRYYEQDSMLLDMKVVVGKPATKTPRFAAYCFEAIMYPYWNVPHSIAVKEIIPKYRRNKNALNALNMTVVDSKGNVVNPSNAIAQGFKGYRFRQSTGCDNALGVLKFNLSDPYSVYMHDTDYKNAFKLSKRYLSHGCIRLEKPIELGDYLLPGKINKSLLAACVKSQTPTSIKIDKPVPVFVIYLPVDIQDGGITYYKDIYRLLSMK